MEKKKELLKLLKNIQCLVDQSEFNSKGEVSHAVSQTISLVQDQKDEAVGRKIKTTSDRLERLSKKIYSKNYKPRSRLVDPKKTKIPGFSYHFKK